MKLIESPSFLLALGAAAAGSTASAQVSFTASGVAATGQRAETAVFADFNGDGLTDMAVTTDGATGTLDLVEFHQGAGNGTFTLAATVFLPASSSPHGLVATDADGDGDIDLAVSLADNGQVVLLSNMGPFSFLQTSSAATGGVESRNMIGADIDGDGDTDFIVANRDSSNVSVVLNQGGVLTSAGAFGSGDELRDVAAGDFNGDGFMDVAATSHDDRTVRIFNGNGTGTLTAGQVLSVPAGTRPQGIAAADMDGDGDLDLVVGTGDDALLALNSVAVYTNTGAALIGPIAYATGGLDAGDVLVGDFDGDGDLDVAVANESSGTIALLANGGTGALTLAGTLTAAGVPSNLAGGDIDGNGSMDIGATRRQTSGVSIFLNDNAGTPPIGTNYCGSNPNSTGLAATISATGSSILAQNDLVLTCTQMPANVFGLWLVSQTTGFVPGPGGSQGNLCLAGQIGRYNQAIFLSGALGQGSLAVDLNLIPQPATVAAATVGQVWNFQCWYRDVTAAGQTSNYSDGFAVTIR